MPCDDYERLKRDAIDHASASERVKLTKRQKKLQEQSLEIQKYEEKIITLRPEH